MSDAREMTQLIRRLSWFAVAAVGIMALTVAGSQLAEDRALEAQANKRERARLARTTLSAATDRETGIRGYLLTGDERSLVPNTVGKAQLPRLLDSLASLARHDPDETERLRSASDALATWETGFAEPAVKGVLSREDTGLAGKHLFDVVRARFGSVIADADGDYRASTVRANAIHLAGAIVVLAELIAFVVALLYLIRGRLVAQTSDLTRQQSLLEQQAIELEVQMEEMNLTNESLAKSLDDLQKKDAELAASLRQREEAAAFLDSALASAPVGFVFWDKNLRIIKANRRLSAARGLEPSDYVGKTVADLAPTLAAQMQAVLESILATGQAADNVQLIESNADGRTVRRQRGTFYPVTKPDGSLIAIGGIVVNVGDEYEREQRIHRSEERYRYVSRATRDAVYEWDTSTNVFQWNEGITDLFGYAPGDIDDSPNWITTLVHPDDVQQVTDSFSDALTAGSERWQLSYRLRRKDGKYASVEGRAHILRDEDGTPTRVIGAITDRSQQQSLEDQLRQAQKMEAIGRLAGGIAHDFNNVLTVVRMSSEFLMDKLEPESESHQEAEEIMKAADRAAGLTRQLLAFSRHQVLNPRVVILNEIVEGIKGMLMRVVPENINVVTDLAADLHPIKADTGQMEQVLLNLAINAADAMPEGGRLDIRTSNTAVDAAFSAAHFGVEPGSYVCLTVSDTGHGMSKETVEKIFEPFYTTKALGKGTGLGLATVHGIVTQTGGKIWVYSEPGHGATFKVFIPRSSGIAKPLTPRSTKRLAPASGTILLVEDETATREAVERSLTRAGYRVLLAENGLDALRVVEANPSISLVLTDSMMPDMGGLELAERLEDTRPEILVLMMSGYTEQAVKSKGSISEHSFIEKPFAAADLLAAIDRLLHKATR